MTLQQIHITKHTMLGIEFGLIRTHLSARKRMSVLVPDPNSNIVPFVRGGDAAFQKAQACATAAFCRRWRTTIEAAKTGDSDVLQIIDGRHDEEVIWSMEDDDFVDLPAMALMGVAAVDEWVLAAGENPDPDKLKFVMDMRDACSKFFFELDTLMQNAASEPTAFSPVI